jgi:hypothetical protein
MEKTFIDLYLLDLETELLEEYGSMFKFMELNAFEKCLLFDVMTRNG